MSQALHEKKKIEALEELDFKYQEETRLIKVSDNLYVPENFDQNHNYYADEAGTKRYWGITTILGVIAKPALIQWAANMACDYVREKVVDPISNLPKGEVADMFSILQTLPDVLEEARYAHTKKKEKAGEEGTSIHEQIEKLIKASLQLDGKLEAYMIQEDMPEQVKEFVQWAIVNNVKFLGSEVRLCSQKLYVAGTADFIAEVNGKLMVGDVKTSSAIYPEHIWQATAYAFMAREMGLYEDFKGVVIVNVPKRGGIKVQENYDLKGNFQIFKGALAIFKGKEAQKVRRIKK